MDKVLKRRLVGATILIALAVIFVPMLLSPPEDELEDRQLAMDIPPAPETEREVRRIPLDPDAARRRQPEPDPDPDPETDPEPGPVPEPPPVTTEVEPEPTLPEAGIESDPGPEPGFETTPDPEPERPSAVPAEAGGSWVVQVGSFSSADSAATVSERLESLGHRVLTDVIVRGDSSLHRLRTGPYGSESEARQAMAQVAATVAGVDPAVVRISGEAPPADPEAGGYAVQVGTFASRDNAQGLTERLETAGYSALMLEDPSGARTIWRVRVGPVPDRAAADSLRARLIDEQGMEGMVVSHP